MNALKMATLAIDQWTRRGWYVEKLLLKEPPPAPGAVNHTGTPSSVIF